MKEGDVILVMGTSPISKFLKYVVGMQVSHAAIYLGKGKMLEALYGTNKVVISPIDNLKKERLVVVRKPYYLDGGHAGMIALRYLGVMYDRKQMWTLGLYFLFRKFGLDLPFLIEDNNARFVCSDLVCSVYKHYGYRFSKDCTPQYFLDSLRFETIFDSRKNDLSLLFANVQNEEWL